MKATQIINKEICDNKFLFENLNSTKGKSYYNGVALKKIFEDFDILTVSKNDIEDTLDKMLPVNIFSSLGEKELNKKILTEKLMRYQGWEQTHSKKGITIRKGNTTTVNVKGTFISVDYHFIKVDDTNKTVTVYKVRNKKNPLKATGRTPSTSIKKNKELFLLQSVGRTLYPSYDAFGCLVFLSNEKDKNDEVAVEFETKPNENVVVKFYDSLDVNEMEDEVEKIILTSNHTCSKSQCEQCNYKNICNYNHRDLSLLKKIPPIAKASEKVKFTTAQLEFIEANQNNRGKIYQRILACAGSGKTTVIANNVVGNLKNGVLPQDILLITFTAKGVEEIKEKIFYWINEYKLNVDMDKLNIFTFNSFGYELIKKEYKTLGYTNVPEVLDKMEQMDILQEIVYSFPHLNGFNYINPFMNLGYAKGVIIKIVDIFNEIKRLGLSFDFEVEDEFDFDNATAVQIMQMYKRYNEILKSRNRIDFNDQVILAYELLSDESILNKYGYGYIICDEFQDSDSVQINMLNLLSNYKYCNSLSVCGDDSQSIFGWRGADQSNIINFNHYFPETKDINMSDNFRSTVEICELANYIDSLNEDSMNKKIIAHKNGKTPTLINGGLSSIVQMVENDINNGLKPQDIAIISRTKKALLEAQNLLDNRNIPSLVNVSEKLIDNPKIKNIIGFSNFLLDETLDLHFAEYLQVAKYNEFEKAKVGNFHKFIADEKAKFMKNYLACSNPNEQLQFFYKILEDLSKQDTAIKKLLDISKGKSFSNIKYLVNFLNNMLLFESDYFIEKNEDKYEAVTLITAHSSKGKEYQKVYIDLEGFKFNIVDKDFEQIRLLFVAITRAQEELVMASRRNTYFVEKINDYYKNRKII